MLGSGRRVIVTGILIFAGLMVITAVGGSPAGRFSMRWRSRILLNDPAMTGDARRGPPAAQVFAMVMRMCAAGGALGAAGRGWQNPAA